MNYDELVRRLEQMERLYEMHLAAATLENWKGHAEAWRKFGQDAAAATQRTQRELAEAKQALSDEIEFRSHDERER